MRAAIKTVERFRHAGTALLTVAFARLALSILGFERVRSLLLRRLSVLNEPAGDARAEARARRIVDRVQRAGELLHVSCLVRALAAQILLLRSGYRSDLKIGVTKEDGHLEAHAWLVRKGRVLIGGDSSQLRRYSVLQEDADQKRVPAVHSHEN